MAQGNTIVHRAYRIYRNGGLRRLALDSSDVMHVKAQGVFSPMLIQRAIKNFNEEAKKRHDLSSLVDLASTWHYGTIKFNLGRTQKKAELMGLLGKVSALKPKIVIEIGTHKGGTFFALSRAADEHATMISIDMPTGKGGLAPDKVHKTWRQLQKGVILPTQNYIAIDGNSHDKSTRDKLAHELHGKEADFLFIDGDHSYEGAMEDFEMYSPFVRKGGIIGFHDINKYEKGIPSYLGGGGQFGSVAQWEYMKKKYPNQTEEFISGDAMGIGVFTK